MKITLNRTISFLLALAMVFGMLPAFGTLKAYAIEPELVGFFEEVSCPEPGKIYVRGWGADKNAPATSVQIHVYVGAPAVVGEGHNLGPTTVFRSDVNTTVGLTGEHGFECTFDTEKYGNQEVYVYAVIEGVSYKQIGGPISVYVSPPKPAYGDQHWNLSKYDYCPEKPDGVYRIVSAANPNYSLDIFAGGETDGTNLHLYANGETDAQLFHLRRVSYQDIMTGFGLNETRTIVSLMNIKSQRFLDKDAGSNNVHQFGTLPNYTNRQWIMHNNGDGTYSFESVAQPEWFMTIVDGKIENGKNIAVAPPNSDGKPTIYQKFYLNAEFVHGDNRLGSLDGFLKTGEYRLWTSSANNRNDTRVLDIPNASKDQGTQAQIWTAGNDRPLHEIFDIRKAEEGWYTIRNISSGLYLVAANGAAGRNLDAVQQLNTNSDAAKWAFVPRVRTDGTLSYWIVNKATGLYLFHYGNEDGSLAVVCSVDNSSDKPVGNASALDYDWRSWGMEACLSVAPEGTVINGATGIAADQFDITDTISLPIKIYDYNDDGLLFEYSLGSGHDNGGFSLVAGSTNANYPSWTIGRTTFGKDYFPENQNNYFVGSGQFWNSSPDGLNSMYMVVGSETDLEYLAQLLGYSFYGEMISGSCTMGLVKPTLREVDGNRLMEYNDEVVAYVADLLDWTLTYREQYEKGEIPLKNDIKDVPIGKPIEAYGDDMAKLLLTQLKAANGDVLLRYSNDPATRRQEIYSALVETYGKQDKLIGTWNECKEHITTYTDAAYFILNNLFYPASYNMPQDKFDYLVLSKATLTNGKTAYVFDSDFSDTYNYVAGTTKSAVKYDFTAKTIFNTSMLGKPFDGSAHYTFLPVWESEGVQIGTNNPYKLENQDFTNKNYNYVLQCNGKFTYNESEGLFFDFEGDDDVYLFINGQLVLDIGGAHSATAINMNLNDYVYAARAEVAAGTATDRDRALALVDGEEYSFDFYYMERHTSGANMRIATNIRVSDPNLDTDKKAYQGGLELNNGGLVNADENVEYSFKLSNPANSISNLYHLTFADAKLGVTIDSANGLTVSGSKTLNSVGTALTAADLKIYFTNQKGETHEVTLDGGTAEEKNVALKNYLKEVNGHGLLPGCSIEIRGIYYNIENSDFVSGRFTNTLHITANQKADGSGSTYQDSVNMVVCSASGPQYYQWAGHSLSVATDKFTSNVNALLTEGSALLEQIAPATSLGTVTKLELCDMKGNVIPSSYVTASPNGISINYSKPGTYIFYVKVTQSDNSTVIIPVQAYVVDVEDSVFVLDYGLKVDLMDVLTAKDTLSIAGKTTSYSFEAVTGAAPSYENNHIAFSDAGTTVDGAYGNFVLDGNSLEYQPDQFMAGADSIYVAVRVYEGTASEAVGTVNINTEVEMYKKITILPANVVYYEDDFPAITYYGNGDGKTANTYTTDGGSETICQSADQSVQYGYDGAYDSGTANSGSSAHVIKILDANIAAQFRFTGTGFELISRCMAADNCVIYLDVLDSEGKLVKRIPVIMEYDDIGVESNEGIYQVPVVRVDNLKHGTYTVQIHGVPVYTTKTTSIRGVNTASLSSLRVDGLEHDTYAMRLRGVPVYTMNSTRTIGIDTTNPATLYIDGLRIYNPLSMSDSNRDHYIDGEDTASFLEIRDLVLEGKAAVVKYDANNYSITTGTSTFTENRTGVLYPINTFTINSVSDAGYFADVRTDTEPQELVLRTAHTKLGNHQFEFTFAKTVDGTDYYYIHLGADGTERYMKSADNAVMLVASDLASDEGLLWQINYLDVDAGIVTICNKDGAYLSVSSVDTAQKTGRIQTLSVDTVTDAQKWELGAVPSKAQFVGNEVTSVNDYLVFGPNNELYLDGVNNSQAVVFYFTPDTDPATTTMLQVGVHVLNDNRLFGKDGELEKTGKLWQSANTGTPGWKVMDDDIRTSTERYYSIDLSACKYDEANNRYEVVLYCEDGYLSFTNLKVSGGSICTVNGEIADLRYNNGVLELLTKDGASEVWTAVPDPREYVDFASLSKQMCATTIYEPDVDTGDLVPVLPDNEEEDEDEVKLVARSLLFEDIIRVRFYFDICAAGITTTTPENSGLLVWTEEEYAALDTFTVDTAGEQIRGLTYSANGYYADTQGIPAKNMVDQLYACAYVILPDGSYVYSDVTQYSPVTYAQRILSRETSSQPMKELVVAMMNYGAAAQVFFNYKTDTLMNDWLTDEQRNYAWSDDLMRVLPTDTSKYKFTVNDQIVWRAASVSFTGAVNQNYYFEIPEELMQGALKVELLYWSESDYNALSELTVENARKIDFNTANCSAVIEGTAAKALGDASYFAVHIVYEDGEAFSRLCVYSAHHYARRLLSKNATSDAMKELAKALVYYSCKAKNMFGG